MVDDRHPQLPGGGQVEGQVVDVDALLRRDAGALGAQLVHAFGGLADPLFGRDHDAVEEFVEHRAGVAVHAPRVRHQRRADSRPVGPADRVDHQLVGVDAREEAVDQALGGDVQQGREAALELVLGQLAGLQLDQQLARLGVGFEAPHQLRRVDPGAQAVGVEGGEQVRRQHPSPVDQQAAAAPSVAAARRASRRPARPQTAAVPRATSSAWRASSRTPSPNVFR